MTILPLTGVLAAEFAMFMWNDDHASEDDTRRQARAIAERCDVAVEFDDYSNPRFHERHISAAVLLDSRARVEWFQEYE